MVWRPFRIDPTAPAEAIARRAGFPEGPGRPASGAGEETVRELLLRGKAIGVKTSPTIVVGGEAAGRGARPRRHRGAAARRGDSRTA
ncbi:hypothetical protein [Streptomyces sp. NPDC059761]|uniref:hypothetical protein n=1 Tax=Streptomyces sp. NPDC059761 TaxID=3346937 RepID=UPI00366466F8